MRIEKHWLLLFLLSLNISCQKNELNRIKPKLLIGDWDLVELKEDGNNLLISVPVQLEMQTDNRYQKNEITGSWEYQKNVGLTFTPDSTANSFETRWNILQLDEEQMQLGRRIDGVFDPISIVEIYSRK